MHLIYDVGAHQGEDTEYYLKKGFKVVAVEAEPSLATGLRERFKAFLDSGQLVLVQAAVADKEGDIEFFRNEDSTVWGTIHEAWAARNEKLGTRSSKVIVQAVRFEELLKQHGVPYYLKVDIEGADMLCISALQGFQTRPRFISVESNKTSWRELVAEFDVFRELGYERFKVVNQARIEEQAEPTPVREGKFAGHRFPFGSTGLFGDDLPGKWLTRSQALQRYAAIFMRYKLFGDNTVGNRLARRLPANVQRRVVADWYDTHAALPE